MRSSLLGGCLVILLIAVAAAGCFPGSLNSPQRVTPAPSGLDAPTEPPRGLQVITPAPLETRTDAPTIFAGSVTTGADTAAAPTTTPVPSATPAPKPPRGTIGLAAPAGNPTAWSAAVRPILGLLQEAGIKAEEVTSQEDLELIAQPAGGAVLAWDQVLTPVDRMSSVLETITRAELTTVWTGQGTSANFTSIYVPESLLPALEVLLGKPGESVKPQPADGVADAVWQDKMGLGIVAFDALDVRLRAIPLDGESPVRNTFVQTAWPLSARTWLAPVTDRGRAALEKISASLPVSNRDGKKLTVLVMTGVTAMARNSAVAIDRSGDWGFLARLVGPVLAKADITIISNEIPFIKGCVADNRLNNLILCSRLEYFENLALSGVDAVGLTGNHQNDFGYDAMRESLAFYKEKRIPVYGGGADEKLARAPLILEHNGNRLGFLGGNQWGPEWYYNGKGESVSSWAGPENPGSARFVLSQMQADIQAVKPQVDLVFAEAQHTEFNAQGDYQTEPIEQQEIDFRGMIDAGADVVTGVQAHAPQAMELRNGKVILYGLGNLYFDQTWSWPTRTGLVARHTIYDGAVINTELLVTVIEKNFQLRWATTEERAQVLRSVFDASRW